MLVEFSVENYRSFKERVTFSMLASDSTAHEEANVVTMPDGTRLLKSAVIYGANASGKSNLIRAMEYLGVFIANSANLSPNIHYYRDTFALDKEWISRPIKFDVIFYVKETKYAYGIVFEESAIKEEYLYSFDDGKQLVVFERSLDIIIPDEMGLQLAYKYSHEFGSNPNWKKLNEITQFVVPYKSFLSVAVALNQLELLGVYSVLCGLKKYTIDRTVEILRGAGNLSKDTPLYGGGYHDFVKNAIHWVKEIDVGITNVLFPYYGKLLSDNNKKDNSDATSMYKKILAKITTLHGDENELNFLEHESEGTKAFFAMAVAIAEKRFIRSIMLVDELSCHFHPLLSKRVVEIFNSKKDTSRSQLIFTTHDTNLLDLDLFRRDQIWFVEKSTETGASEIFSLHDFDDMPVDSSEIDVEKSYLYGAYGAIPFIKDGLIDGGEGNE